jgi:hypothetical protein
MKGHHWILFMIGVMLVGGFLFWPRSHSEPPVTDELTGTWHAGGTNAADLTWSMEYRFNSDQSYILTTGTDYGEEGTYVITNRYLDGSIEVEKTFRNGEKIYTMVVLTTDDPNIIYLEGVKLNRTQ